MKTWHMHIHIRIHMHIHIHTRTRTHTIVCPILLFPPPLPSSSSSGGGLRAISEFTLNRGATVAVIAVSLLGNSCWMSPVMVISDGWQNDSAGCCRHIHLYWTETFRISSLCVLHPPPPHPPPHPTRVCPYISQPVPYAPIYSLPCVLWDRPES